MPVGLCKLCECTAHSDQKRAPDPLDTGVADDCELLRRCWGEGTEFPARTVRFLSH